MEDQVARIEKSYRWALGDGRGGHISVADDGRAVLVGRFGTGKIEAEVFSGTTGETGEIQAQKWVRKNLDADAEFAEDPYLDLVTWLLQIGDNGESDIGATQRN